MMSETNKTGFRLIRAGDLEVRAPQWLITGIMERDSLALLFGDPSTGKSFIAIDAAACVATGTPFHGHKIAQRGAVVYIAGEGHAGIARRLKAWSIHNKVDLGDAPLFISTLPATLCDAETMGEIGKIISAAVEAVGPPVLIVLDTWARNLGGDENSTFDTSLAIAAVDRMRAPWKAAVLTVHHVGHSDKTRARGAIALRGALDVEYRVDRGADEKIRVECTKAKDIAPPAPFAFTLCDVDLGLVDEEGLPVVSAVLMAETYEPEQAPKAPSGKNQRAALDVLTAEIQRHRTNVEDSGRDPDDARVSVDAWRSACIASGLPRNRFYDARLALLTAGTIQIIGGHVSIPASGPVSCPVPYYIRKPDGPDKPTPGQTGIPGQKPDKNRTKTGLTEAQAETAIAAVDEPKGADDDQVF